MTAGTRRAGRTIGGTLAALVLAVGAAGCSGGSEDDADAAATPDYDVIAPGEPGEEASTVAPEDVEDLGPEDAWNAEDVSFVEMMVPHHAQALEMSALVPTRTTDERVRGLAERIEAGQRPEILTMSAWLEDRGEKVPRAVGDHGHDGHGDHGDGGHAMAGMLTEEEMDALAAARGDAFDQLFLRGMIRHHQGAVDMAQTVQRDGEDVRVNELAADVAVGQTAEITRMREMLGAR